jgi:hypothetical protein
MSEAVFRHHLRPIPWIVWFFVYFVVNPIARLPEPDHGVGIQHRIDTDYLHGLDHRLGNEQTVERVSVMERQGRQDGRVLHRDGQDCEVVLRDLTAHERLERDRECILPEADFDCNLPVARGANVLVIERVDDEAQRGGTQPWVCQDDSEERMCIEEQSHSM